MSQINMPRHGYLVLNTTRHRNMVEWSYSSRQ